MTLPQLLRMSADWVPGDPLPGDPLLGPDGSPLPSQSLLPSPLPNFGPPLGGSPLPGESLLPGQSSVPGPSRIRRRAALRRGPRIEPADECRSAALMRPALPLLRSG